MEPRIARLEASVDHIERDIAELKLDVREFRSDMRDVRERQIRLEEKVAHLPGKGFIVTSLLLSLGVITALLAFQGQIQKYAGLATVAATDTP